MSRSRDYRPSHHLRPAVLAILAALLLGTAAPIFAQTAVTWSSTADTTFSTGANWTGGTAPADSLTTNSAAFDGTGTANPVLTSSQSLQGISFINRAYTLSATGGAVLTLGAGGIAISAGNSATVSADIVLGANQSWTTNFASGQRLTVSGNVSGNFSLSKITAGTLLLTGTNTYTGTTTVATNGGTLHFGKVASLYNGNTASWTAANLTVNSGGSVVFNVGGTGEFTTGNISTLLTNLSTVSSNGLMSGSAIGFDTTNAAGGTFTIADVIANSTGTGGGSIGVNKLGAGTLVLTGANTYTGPTSVSAGTLDLGSTNQTGNTITLTGGAAITSTNGAGSISGTRFDLQDGTVGAVLAGTGALDKNGGGTVVLSGANTFTGRTTINRGTLSINSLANLGTASALGAPTSSFIGTIGIGSTTTAGILRYTGGTASTNRVINLAGTTGGATLDSSGTGPLTFTSAFTATGAGSKTLTLTGTATGNTIAGAIVNNSGTNLTSISKTGAGSWILSGNNTYTGSTGVSAGTLQIGAGGTSGSVAGAGISVTGSGALVFNRSDTLTFAGVVSGSGTGGVTQAGSGTLVLTGANTYTGGTTISAGTLQIGAGGTTGAVAGNIANNATLSFNRSNALTYAGIVSGSGTLAQSGSGTLTLTAAHTYTGGTAISAGTLLVNGSLAAGSAVSVASGATLGGGGTINGATTVSDGGTLSPGTGRGLLTFGGNLTLNSGAASVFEINGTARGTTYDAVNVAGLASYGGTLTLSFGSTLADGTTLNLFGLNGGSAGTLGYVTATGSYAGNFSNAGGTWTLTSLGQTLTFSESTGNLALGATAIPEPSTYAAILGAAAFCLAWYRRGKIRAVAG